MGFTGSKRKGLKMKTIMMEVTQRDIDRAIERKRTRNAPGLLSCNCPLALAGRRKFHNVSQAYSHRLCVYKHYSKKKQKSREYNLDSAGLSIMHNFDEEKYNLLKPCVVTLTSVPR